MRKDANVPDDPVEMRLLLQALVDGELDAATALGVERRIAADPALAAEHARLAAIARAVRGLPRSEVGDSLRARIAAIGGEETPVRAARNPARPGRPAAFDWRAMAASVMVTAVLASGGTWWLAGGGAGPDLADAVADAHRRGLLAASPVDVASSDRHTVKPWLDGRIGLSPPAVDLSAQGFRLIGGRVEVIDDRPLPALVYRYNEHLITLVALPRRPGAAAASPADLSAGGLSLVHWSDSAFSYWAASDAERHVLDDFARRFREAVAKE